MTGKGLETQTAANMLRKYAVLAAEIGCHPKQVEHIHFVITQMEKDFNMIREQRDEIARQLEESRRLACHYADIIWAAHESQGFIESDWKPVWKA